MNEVHSFAPLLIVVMLAFLVPLLLSSVRGRLAIPIVGEIVAGMIVGGSGLGWVVPDKRSPQSPQRAGFLPADVSSGMEIDFRSLRRTDPHQPR